MAAEIGGPHVAIAEQGIQQAAERPHIARWGKNISQLYLGCGEEWWRADLFTNTAFRTGVERYAKVTTIVSMFKVVRDVLSRLPVIRIYGQTPFNVNRLNF